MHTVRSLRKQNIKTQIEVYGTFNKAISIHAGGRVFELGMGWLASDEAKHVCV